MTEYELVDLIKDTVSLLVAFGAVIGSLCLFYAFCMFVEVTGNFFETMKEKMKLFRTKKDEGAFEDESGMVSEKKR